MQDEEASARRSWFRQEVLPLEPQLRRYLRKIAPRDCDLDDLVHDVLVRVISAANWAQVGAPSAFVRATARNLVYDELRRRRVVALDYVADLEAEAFREEGADAEQTLIARSELKALARLVSTLPPQCRTVFTLRKIYGLSPGAIAVRLGLSVSTVEKHLVKGLRLCAQGLADLDTGSADGRDAATRQITTRAGRTGGR